MKSINVNKSIDLELVHVSEYAFCIEIRWHSDEQKNTLLSLGMIYAYRIDNPMEDTKKYLSITTYLDNGAAYELSDDDLKNILQAIKNHGLIHGPAIMIAHILPRCDLWKKRRSFQIGKIYYDDPDPYPSLDEQLQVRAHGK